MNIHHLELFHYVARHGGISEAVRNIPYGIQQPAVSAQILTLEEFLGVKLFNRRPFHLTPAGEKLYQFIQPFFTNLERVSAEIRGTDACHLRFGASATVLREHLPALFHQVQKKFPNLKLSLHEGLEPDLIGWLEKQEIDLAVTVTDGKPPAGLHAHPLLRLPLVLLVPAKSPVKTAEDLWHRDKIEETLVSPPPSETICKHFQHGLAQRGVDWLSGITVNSIELIETYVANGFGIGLSVVIPNEKHAPGIRRIPLPDFEPIVLSALWRGPRTPTVEAFLEAMQQRARTLADELVVAVKDEVAAPPAPGTPAGRSSRPRPTP